MRTATALTLFLLARAASPEPRFDLDGAGEFFAMQHKCVKDMSQCLEWADLESDDDDSYANAESECCTELAQCWTKTNVLHPVDADGDKIKGANHLTNVLNLRCPELPCDAGHQ